MRYIVALLLMSSTLSAVPAERANELDVRDSAAVVSFLNSKRTINYNEKLPCLTISGDIRAEWFRRSEKRDGERQRGANNHSFNSYEAEFNLKFNYKADRAYGFVLLQADNDMGTENHDDPDDTDEASCIGSGECDDSCLKRAYMGYHVYKDCGWVFDVELGRRPLYTIFDSRIQFHARFDGALFKLSHHSECFGEYYLNGGPFIVDYVSDHYAYVAELGVLNLMNKRVDVKYSYINWVLTEENRYNVRRPDGWRFRNSQVSLAYNFDPACWWFKRKAKLYSAIVVNHVAQKKPITHKHHKNVGWYAGFIMGDVKKEGDWSFDINYQVVQAQAVANADVHGMSLGNVNRETFTDLTGRGKANYKGIHMEALYAITDKLSIDPELDIASSEDAGIGRHRAYTQFQLNLIQAF